MNDKSFSHAIFSESSVHILGVFSMNKSLFLVTESCQNNALFPPTCPKLMKIAPKLALNSLDDIISGISSLNSKY